MLDYQLISAKHIKQDVLSFIIDNYQDSINEAVLLIKGWLVKESWETKMFRKHLISNYDFHDIVTKLFTHICMMGKLPLLSMCESFHLSNEMNKLDNTKTVMEILVILCDLNLYDIARTSNGFIIYPTIPLPQILSDRIQLACFVPPKQQAKQVFNNTGLILGDKFNAHNKPIALDVINRLNRQQYELDTWFISNYSKPWFREEVDITELSDNEKRKYLIQLDTWHKYKEQLEFFIKQLSDKPLYFNHKYDKRGRIYTVGYHFNTQGTSYEKACINLKHKEFVTGEL